MVNHPTHIIESDKYGWNGGRFRLAFGDDNVRNSIRGLLVHYPDAEVTVWSLSRLDNETHRFLIGESKDVAPF
jgi:hypothetical protein